MLRSPFAGSLEQCPSAGGVPPEVQPVGPVLAGTLRGRLPRPSDLSVWEDTPTLSPWEHQKRSGHSCDPLTSAPTACLPLTFPPALQGHSPSENQSQLSPARAPLVAMRAVYTTELSLLLQTQWEPGSDLSHTHTHSPELWRRHQCL